jgi:energy-coupling factor transport system substrate-specific component
VTWQVVTFALLGVVVAGGFAWYERSRPPARVVALVAALAALAVAGRLALTPVPNVVATTDIALITGYALGAAPGFAVGALAAPVSNIWLGQGPWTAWQMAGWGLVGLAGAWVAFASGRRLNRYGLAAVCGLAGLAFGALLDLSVMVTYGGEQSLDRYLALSARGIPFNLAHMTGNVAIALAAGPALVRMISRFRSRLEFEWRPAGVLPVAAVALVAVLSAGLAAPPGAGAGAGSPVAWLTGNQNDDGGFAATPGQPSSPAMTGWAMLGLEAAGRNPLDLRTGGGTPVSYLRDQVDRLRSVGDLERTVLALVGAGVDPRRFAGSDLVAQLRDRRSPDGSVDGQVNLTAFYVLALRAAGVEAGKLGRPARWLREAQNPDGGWGIQPRAPSEADSTGAALQALASVGVETAVADAAHYLRRAQDSSGGFALGGTGVVNSQSTAWAVQGLVASGSSGGAIGDALTYLASVRAADGHYRYSQASDQTPVWVTAEVLTAIHRDPFPLAAVARKPTPEPEPEPEAPKSQSAADPTPNGSPNPAPEPTKDPSDGPNKLPAKHHAPQAPVEKTSNNDPNSTDVEPAPALAPSEPAVEASSSDDADVAPYVLGGLGALVVALAAGFVWYRRRLP